MNTTDLCKIISKKTGISIADVKSVIDSQSEVVQDRLYMGVNVMIKDFISFKTVKTPETKKRDIRTGKELTIPQRYRIKTILPQAFLKKIKEKPCS